MFWNPVSMLMVRLQLCEWGKKQYSTRQWAALGPARSPSDALDLHAASSIGRWDSAPRMIVTKRYRKFIKAVLHACMSMHMYVLMPVCTHAYLGLLGLV